MAAAAEVLRGKALYRDIWFDKPPLYALLYTLWGATPGWPLRTAGVLFVCLSSFIAWRCLRKEAGESAGLLASVLLAVYLTFDIPSSTMALAPDLLTVPLHFAAICLAMKRRAFASGMCAGVALLFNGKALFIALACLLWTPRLEFLAGFALPNIIAVLVLFMTGSLGELLAASLDLGCSLLGRHLHNKSGPRGSRSNYQLAGLPCDARDCGSYRIVAAFFMAYGAMDVCVVHRGVCRSAILPEILFSASPRVYHSRHAGAHVTSAVNGAVAVLCLVLIPVARFGPRYAALAGGNRTWSDLALMNDSRAAAAIVREVARPGDGMLVWGYRPDVYVLAHVPAATPYLDSQPLTGVLADRHLTTSKPSITDLIRGNLNKVANARPAIIVDGLGPLNPELSVTQFPDLQIENYEVAGKTKLSTVYVTKR